MDSVRVNTNHPRCRNAMFPVGLRRTGTVPHRNLLLHSHIYQRQEYI